MRSCWWRRWGIKEVIIVDYGENISDDTQHLCSLKRLDPSWKIAAYQQLGRIRIQRIPERKDVARRAVAVVAFLVLHRTILITT